MLIGSGDRFAKVFSSLCSSQEPGKSLCPRSKESRQRRAGLTSASLVAIAKRRKPPVLHWMLIGSGDRFAKVFSSLCSSQEPGRSLCPRSKARTHQRFCCCDLKATKATGFALDAHRKRRSVRKRIQHEISLRNSNSNIPFD
jgi:hypothetical protein